MTRGTKYFLSALVASLISWLFGVYLVGIASFRHYTAHGDVDMSNTSEIQLALADPTFTAELGWGAIKLTGLYWSFALPLLLAAGAFFLVVAAGLVRRKARAAN